MAFLDSGRKEECFGCEACAQACEFRAISMLEDEEGFRYPHIDALKCVPCGMCRSVCPYDASPDKALPQYVFGGYHIDPHVRQDSTSGGAFSAIADAWCDENYVIFGAASVGIEVTHCHSTDKADIGKFRKSKYVQSSMGSSYAAAKKFLCEGKKVLFSGTPCQIAGLKAFLGRQDRERLLTVEVICEGVPSPHFIRSYGQNIHKRYGCGIKELDYRYKDGHRWDFQVMSAALQNGCQLKTDRWFNPFWSIWLEHLMSRPSCYQCPYAARERVADITLGDLWGVHLYCPELYGNNGGASLVLCSTEKGKHVMTVASHSLYGHELDLDTALKYQSPLRKPIDGNPQREAFMRDLARMDYVSLCKKWASPPSFRLLWSKYVWGNRQKVFIWNLFHNLRT